ncbi:hypothetical protein B0H14DRAFT_2563910 [Mycena olivaceomarginata]|nr:hypothetical protein B0H14DRAFT_2563910 [Mycena olivaceomarginata]
MEAPVKHSQDVDELGREDHNNLETKNDNDNDEMPPLVADNVDGKSILPAQSPFLIWFFVQVTTTGGVTTMDDLQKGERVTEPVIFFDAHRAATSYSHGEGVERVWFLASKVWVIFVL